MERLTITEKKEKIMEYTIGKMQKGPRNSITDVAGVRVGHCTVDNDQHKTGVTVVMPCEDDIYMKKMVAASHVLNGFGKTAGLVQIDELGTLETPIALTGTLNVGKVHDAMVEYMFSQAENNNYSIWTVNPIVAECNDAYLNDVRHRAIGQKEVFEAIAAASETFEEGDVGAGKGMSCHGLKGGIGSSSRIFRIGEETFTIGVLTLTNHGLLEDLMIDGNPIGKEINKTIHAAGPDKGSCIMVVATDLPVTCRQLQRIIRRCSVGLARLGSYIGHGSGEIMIGFSTANRIPAAGEILNLRCICENHMDTAFRAVAEATEESVLRAMLHAKTVTGYNGKIWNTRRSLTEFL